MTDEWEVVFPKYNAFKAKILSDGYLWDDELDMSAHRAVAVRLLKRELTPEEQVHHIDHNKRNNTPTNLLVCNPLLHFMIHRMTQYALMYKGELGLDGGNLLKPEHLIEFLWKLGTGGWIWLGGVK